MAETDVARLPRPLPDSIRVAQNMTPNEMRLLKAHTGRPLSELLGGDPEDMDMAPDRIQSLVWVALRRAGYEVSWDDAGDVLPDTSEADVDPTSAAPSTG
jgi:hypothetical protein